MKGALANLINELADTFWVYSGIPYVRGMLLARRDLRNGRLALKTYGKPAAWRDAYAEILQQRHGIHLESVCNGPVSGKMREHIRGYNSVAKEEIRRRHGRDFLDSIVEEAKEVTIKARRKSD